MYTEKKKKREKEGKILIKNQDVNEYFLRGTNYGKLPFCLFPFFKFSTKKMTLKKSKEVLIEKTE